MAIYKNKASQKITVYAVDAAGDPKTGDAAQITAKISKDGGATATTNDVNPTELSVADAPGYYIFDLLQAETNADMVIISPVSSTVDVGLFGAVIYTEPEERIAASVTAAVVTDTASRTASQATGFSTHAAADVWTTGSRELSTPNDYKATGFNTVTPDASGVVSGLLGVNGASLTDLGGMSTAMKAEVQAEADDALVDNHLDHLLKTAYDPASKPGAADALLNEIVEDDGGVSRFTENALEQAPDNDTVTGLTLHSDYDPAKTAAQAGDAMDLVADAVDAAAVKADAVTEIQSGLATETKQDVIDGIVDTILVDSNELQTNQGNWLTITGQATEAKQDVIDVNVDLVLGDSNELQTNQGAWATATGFSTSGALATHDGKLDTVDTTVDQILDDTRELQVNQGNWLTVTGQATEAKQNIIDGIVDTILVDTNELQTNQGNWLTNTLTTAGIWGYSTRTLSSFGTLVADIWTAFNAAVLSKFMTVNTGQTTSVTGSVAKLSQAASVGDVTLATSQPNYAPAKAGEAMDLVADAVDAAAIKADAVTEIQSGLATEAKQDIIDANVDLVLGDTNELQTNQGNWATVTGQATETKQDIIDANVDLVLGDTNELQTNQGNWTTSTTAPTVNAIVTGVLSGVVEGTIDVQEALNRIMACIVNSVEVTAGASSNTYEFKDSAGSATVVEHVIATDGSTRELS